MTDQPLENRFSSFNPSKEQLLLPKNTLQRQATRQSHAGQEFAADISRGSKHRKSHFYGKGSDKLPKFEKFGSDESSSDSLNRDESDHEEKHMEGRDLFVRSVQLPDFLLTHAEYNSI